jgi:hypothetical protein
MHESGRRGWLGLQRAELASLSVFPAHGECWLRVRKDRLIQLKSLDKTPVSTANLRLNL